MLRNISLRSLANLTTSAAVLQQRPLSFNFTDQQKEFQQVALQFAKEVILPKAAEHDRTGEFPWEIIKQAHALGLMNPGVPEAYGGPGCSNIETALIIEALSYGCTGIQLAIMGPSLALAPLLLAGTEEQKKNYAGMLTAEPLIAVRLLIYITIVFVFLVLLCNWTWCWIWCQWSENKGRKER